MSWSADAAGFEASADKVKGFNLRFSRSGNSWKERSRSWLICLKMLILYKSGYSIKVRMSSLTKVVIDSTARLRVFASILSTVLISLTSFSW